MTDKKFTDEEIIKALECCISTTTEEACAGCPFNKQKLCDKDQWALERYALDLISRQKAKIERLKSELSNKKFAEKLEEELCDCRTVSDGEYCGFDRGDIHQTITNLLKEMVGEEK